MLEKEREIVVFVWCLAAHFIGDYSHVTSFIRREEQWCI